MEIIEKEKAGFRIVIHDLENKKSKTISLKDGKSSLNQIYSKLIEFFKSQRSR